jgi:hypothetical protein
MHGVRVQRQRQRVGPNDARLVGQLTVPRQSTSSDRGGVRCRLGGPCRPPVTVGGDPRCRSGVAPLSRRRRLRRLRRRPSRVVAPGSAPAELGVPP